MYNVEHLTYSTFFAAALNDPDNKTDFFSKFYVQTKSLMSPHALATFIKQ